mmetsp:Transcript_33214/g.130756  ORF Transcript_33214/g.130756 Transcript_33214/m.130756 type:complete len:149 (-) Transcript_33214:1429-1875(-)
MDAYLLELRWRSVRLLHAVVLYVSTRTHRDSKVSSPAMLRVHLVVLLTWIHQTGLQRFLLIGLFIALFGAYYVWDTSQSQRTRFRLQQVGAYKPRFTFPQLPWGTLKDPKYLTTETGSKLLISGWWKYARKVRSEFLNRTEKKGSKRL